MKIINPTRLGDSLGDSLSDRLDERLNGNAESAENFSESVKESFSSLEAHKADGLSDKLRKKDPQHEGHNSVDKETVNSETVNKETANRKTGNNGAETVNRETGAEAEADTVKKGAGAADKEPGNLASSRKQIAAMKQTKYFSAFQFVQKGLIAPHMIDKTLLNEYRTLRTKLIASSKKQNFITLVTSVIPNAGSSMIAANLAATFALDQGKTSLLIDANINNPSLSHIFEVESKVGLINYLDSEDMRYEDMLFNTPIPRLRLLPAGYPTINPSEHFTSHRMQQLMKDIVNRYPDRFPIIDAPNITDSADTRILIEFCDKVILVVPYAKCSREEIKNAVSAIGQDKFSGIVLNGFLP